MSSQDYTKKGWFCKTCELCCGIVEALAVREMMTWSKNAPSQEPENEGAQYLVGKAMHGYSLSLPESRLTYAYYACHHDQSTTEDARQPSIMCKPRTQSKAGLTVQHQK